MSTRELESLYPFLADAPAEDHLDHLTASTLAKIAELWKLYERCEAIFADNIERCADAMAERFARGGRLYTFGNGGSATDAADLGGVDALDEHALPALSLAADTAIITALANDVTFDVVFARQIDAFGRPADIACGLSTSGNSNNVIRAFEAARAHGLLTVGFAGYEGGAMGECDAIDHLFVVPSSSVHRIQEAQTALYHVLMETVRARLST